MAEKAKRKGNPRRRLLLQFLVLAIVSTLAVVGGFSALKPSDEPQIAFIAPYNDWDSIWLVSATENASPRLAVALEHVQDVRLFPIPNQDKIIYQYRIDDLLYNYVLNTRTLRSQPLEGIETCPDTIQASNCHFQLHNDWILRKQTTNSENTRSFSVHLHHISTGEHRFIFETGDTEQYFFIDPQPSWLTATNQVVYRDSITSDAERYIFYDVALDEVVEDVPINSISFVDFSPDGTRYTQYNTLDRVTYVYETGSSEPYLTIVGNENNTKAVASFDWHPSGDRLLMRYRIQELGWASGHNEYHLYEYYLDQAMAFDTALTDYTIQTYETSYNHDGSQILTLRRTRNGENPQLVVITTGVVSEIPLSAFGRGAIWVNGGR